jgi:hypothetical protein
MNQKPPAGCGAGNGCGSNQPGYLNQPGLDDGKAQPTRGGRSGQRHWFRTTGLPGWKRAQLGLPAYGDPRCVPYPRPGSLQRLMGAMRRLLGRRKAAPAALPPQSIQPKVKS